MVIRLDNVKLSISESENKLINIARKNPFITIREQAKNHP